MAKNVTQDREPRDRLARIADRMVMALAADIENPDDDIKAVVLLSQGELGQTLIAGYDDDEFGGVVHTLLEHAEAVAKANGIPLAIGKIPAGPGGQG